jgi:hypothetical protein
MTWMISLYEYLKNKNGKAIAWFKPYC